MTEALRAAPLRWPADGVSPPEASSYSPVSATVSSHRYGIALSLGLHAVVLALLWLWPAPPNERRVDEAVMMVDLVDGGPPPQAQPADPAPPPKQETAAAEPAAPAPEPLPKPEASKLPPPAAKPHRARTVTATAAPPRAALVGRPTSNVSAAEQAAPPTGGLAAVEGVPAAAGGGEAAPGAGASASASASASAGSGGADAVAVYGREVWARIEQNRPFGARKFAGRSVVAFLIGRDGSLLAAEITQSSGSPRHDAAALEAVRSSAPFAPPPPVGGDGSVRFAIPFEFK